MTNAGPQDPTAVTLSLFSAIPQSGHILLQWETALEINMLGYNLYRSTTLDGEKVRLNPTLLPTGAIGGEGGASYEFIDLSVQPGETCYYWLEFVEIGKIWMLDTPELISALLDLFASGDR